MENRKSFLLCFSLGLFLLLISNANAFDKTDPRRNPNLSPFEQWRSAYYCMKNYTRNECSEKNKLNMSGLLSVGDPEIGQYCDKGCFNQTLIVLQCIQAVHRHFKFQSGASVAFVHNAAFTSCIVRKALNTSYSNPNSATSLYGRLYVPLLSTLTTMALFATFS